MLLEEGSPVLPEGVLEPRASGADSSTEAYFLIDPPDRLDVRPFIRHIT